MHHSWPNTLDAVVTALFFLAVSAAVLSGYVCMVLDFRAYLRSLRRTLVCVVNYLPRIPTWARAVTPRCLTVFGLMQPCTEDQLLTSYRRLVKRLHPDRGGNQRRFLTLQSHFEQALALVRKSDRDSDNHA